MANVENFDALGIDAIENLLAVSADDLDSNRWIGRHARTQWIERNVVDGGMNSRDHTSGARHASFAKIAEDAIEIGKRQLPVLDFHSKP